MSIISNSTENKIRFAFNRAATSYDENSELQQQSGKTLLKLIQMFDAYPDNIIDLGCGTGFITQQLHKCLTYKNLYAIDIAENLLEKARSRLTDSRIKIDCQNFENFTYPGFYFNLIFSNMALQWSANPGNTFKNINNNLAVNGILAFSLPCDGTLKELDKSAKNVFLTPSQVTRLLNCNNFEILNHQFQSFKFKFDSWLSAYKKIKAVGANHVIHTAQHSLRGKNFLRNLLSSDQKPVLSYQISYFIARKSKNVS